MTLSVIFWLLTKHLIVDFPLQNAWMVDGKGNVRSLAGYVHAGLHALGTLLVLAAFGLPLWLALLDGVIHYAVDWLKMNAGRWYGWTPAQPAFWWALGADQYAHAVTYVGIVALAAG